MSTTTTATARPVRPLSEAEQLAADLRASRERIAVLEDARTKSATIIESYETDLRRLRAVLEAQRAIADELATRVLALGDELDAAKAVVDLSRRGSHTHGGGGCLLCIALSQFDARTTRKV